MFNHDGPEAECFARFFHPGEPILDVACGTGRLLVPWLKDGLDVDGVDAAADMIDACREAATTAGFSPALTVSPTHLLDLRRRYGSAVMCGGLGLGVTPAQEVDGLVRIREHLRPGGVLVLDYEHPEFDEASIEAWLAHPMPTAPPSARHRRRGPDGDDYALRMRVLAVSDDRRTIERELTVFQWSADVLVAEEAYRLAYNCYKSDEVVAMLGAAGFENVSVRGGYHGGKPVGDEQFLVYVAYRP
jgi:SAM-dependent methyltransferase